MKKVMIVLMLMLLVACSEKEDTIKIQNYRCDYEYNDASNLVSTIELKTEGVYVKKYKKTDKINVTGANYSAEQLEQALQDIINNVYSVSEGKGIDVGGSVIKDKNDVYIEYYIEADLDKADIQLLRYSNLVDEYDTEKNTLKIEQLKPVFETNDFVCELIEKRR